ncbi:MAG: hypothetical protein Q9187_004168 [Circinaria calcarea]
MSGPADRPRSRNPLGRRANRNDETSKNHNVEDEGKTPATNQISKALSEPVTVNVGKILPPVNLESLWHEAEAQLSEDYREDLNAMRAEAFERWDTRGIADQMVSAVETSKKRCLEKQWTYTWRGKERKVRDQWNVILNGVKAFQSLGDTLAAFDPIHAGLPWAGVKLLLRVALNDSQEFDTVRNGLELLTPLISRYAVVEDLYLKKDMVLTQDLKRLMIDLYSTVLTYQIKAYSHYNRGTLLRIGKATINAVDFSYSEISAKENLIAQYTRIMDKDDLVTVKTMLSKVLKDQNDKLDKGLKLLQQEEKEKSRILEWLSEVNYRDHHHTIQQKTVKGSGQWLLGTDQYNHWRNAQQNSILWLRGNVGTGKTCLVSVVIDKLIQDCANEGEAERIVFFYCSRTEEHSDRREPIQVLRSLVKQLLQSVVDQPTIFNVVRSQYEEKRHSGSGGLYIEECIQVIAEMTKLYQCIIVVDGLDECEPEIRYKLFEAFNSILQRATEKRLKLFLSSRDSERDINIHFNGKPYIQINSGDNADDIEKYIRHEVDKNIHRLLYGRTLDGGKVTPELENQIISSLIEKADGMFLWVNLQLRALWNPNSRLFSQEHVEYKLSRLPSTLEATYDEIYNKIFDVDTISHIQAKRAFKWLLCPLRLLPANEYCKAVSIDPNKRGGSDNGNLQPQDIVELCNNLVIYKESLDIVDFSHLSVREYLLARKDYEYLPDLVHAQLAMSCLSFLHQTDVRESRDIEVLGSFANYAMLYWPNHCELAGGHKKEGRLQELFHCFVLESEASPAFSRWIETLPRSTRPLQKHDRQAAIRNVISSPPSTLFLACRFGFEDVLRRLPPQSLQKRDRKNRSAFEIACGAEQKDVVAVLLERNTSEHKVARGLPMDRIPMLHTAILQGRKEVVELLLLNPVLDINNAEYLNEQTPIHLAVSLHDDTIARWLLDRGANTDTLDNRQQTPLHLAVIFGISNTVRLLLQRGANFRSKDGNGMKDQVNTRDGNGMTALELAMERGDVDIQKIMASPLGQKLPLHEKVLAADKIGIREMLELNISVDIEDEYSRTPLHLATAEASVEIVELLLAWKPRVDVKEKIYEHTPLHLAASIGSMDITRLALERAADVNAKDKNGRTALHLAAKNGLVSVSKLLLDHGAEIESKDRHGQTPLHLAAASGSEQLVELLLSRRANAQTKDFLEQIPLHLAAAIANKTLVSMLLTETTELNAANFLSETPLHLAASAGNADMIELLLEQHADRYATCRGELTASHLAARAGSSFVVKLLADNGADLDAKDDTGMTPLHLAAEHGHAHVIKLLVGANLITEIDIMNDQGFSPLQVAIQKGQRDVIKILLDHNADVNASETPSGLTPLHLAFDPDIAEELLDRQANINASDRGGHTVLHTAAKEGHLDVIKLLLGRSIDFQAQNHAGETALDVAKDRLGTFQIGDELEDDEADPEEVVRLEHETEEAREIVSLLEAAQASPLLLGRS